MAERRSKPVFFSTMTLIAPRERCNHSRKNNPALSIVGADLRVCPGRGVRRHTGEYTQVCPYDKHRKIFAQLLKAVALTPHFVHFVSEFSNRHPNFESPF
jgi:hypothetical protein